MTRTTDDDATGTLIAALAAVTFVAVLPLGALPGCRVSGTAPDAPAASDTAAGDVPPSGSPEAGADGVQATAPGGGSPGTCEDDGDCLFQVDTDCCGLCLAQRDTPPPRRVCGTTCPQSPPPCLCVEGRCRSGTLPRNAGCNPARDLCGRGLKCCNVCGGPQADAAAACTNPLCAAPTLTPSGPLCPLPGT